MKYVSVRIIYPLCLTAPDRFVQTVPTMMFLTISRKFVISLLRRGWMAPAGLCVDEMM